ncbi:hypothetical protein BDZ45DRAFT_683481 [Acephala macrosclerotiorum]|nr:hypothetical protein BDZ45DRAFT_683481 [Acephala macrosclerotiorum]
MENRLHCYSPGRDTTLFAATDVASGENCPICTDPLHTGKVSCVKTWLNGRDNCPYCRKLYKICRPPQDAKYGPADVDRLFNGENLSDGAHHMQSFEISFFDGHDIGADLLAMVMRPALSWEGLHGTWWVRSGLPGGLSNRNDLVFDGR